MTDTQPIPETSATGYGTDNDRAAGHNQSSAETAKPSHVFVGIGKASASSDNATGLRAVFGHSVTDKAAGPASGATALSLPDIEWEIVLKTLNSAELHKARGALIEFTAAVENGTRSMDDVPVASDTYTGAYSAYLAMHPKGP